MDDYYAEIKYFAGTFNISGYLLCYGQYLQIAQESTLFSLIGTFYGGDGRVTFQLPDMRGLRGAGWGQGPGLFPLYIGYRYGSDLYHLQYHQLPTHNHHATFNSAGTSPYTATMTAFAGAENQTDPSNNYLSSSSGAIYRDGPGFGVTEVQLAADAISITGGAHDGTVTLGQTGGANPINLRDPDLGLTPMISNDGFYPSRN